MLDRIYTLMGDTGIETSDLLGVNYRAAAYILGP
jgi:hypothetical protein